MLAQTVRFWKTTFKILDITFTNTSPTIKYFLSKVLKLMLHPFQYPQLLLRDLHFNCLLKNRLKSKIILSLISHLHSFQNLHLKISQKIFPLNFLIVKKMLQTQFLETIVLIFLDNLWILALSLKVLTNFSPFLI